MTNKPSKIKENLLVSPFLVLFLVHSSQTGIGLLSFQHEIAMDAGYDAWISLFLIGLIFHLLLFMMFKLLSYSSEGDIISLHRDYFGKWFGNILTLLFCFYFLLLVTTVLRSYVEVLQIWAFNTITIWEFTLLISIIIFYVVIRGFRVITGVVFFSTIIPLILIFVLIYTLKYSHFSNLMPFFNHDLIEIMKSAKTSTISFLGFESILFYYPYIKNQKQSHKWGQAGLLLTTVLYTILAIFTFAYFSEGQLKYMIWPTLIMTKIVWIPFIERFEFIFIFSWLLVILAPICLSLWSTVRGFKRLFHIKPRYSLIGALILLNITPFFLQDRENIEMLGKITSEMGFYLLFLYIPLLFVYVTIVRKIKVRKNVS
ncbi:GerAB/ArcD/ProY family transporter [Sutcliffiella halmapala]|uniref:GerAB/ArcD/ProY family transporter n=1 Tax=Sutcliffiella halmapala TaxID=79882 RepID=UPI00099491C6|nr:GerAB/ArcD/ProY family transporter [Sutcliffiella halmapala]